MTTSCQLNLCLLFLAPAGVAFAQPTVKLPTQDLTVVLRLTDGDRIEGQLTDTTPENLTMVLAGGQEQSLPRADIRSVGVKQMGSDVWVHIAIGPGDPWLEELAAQLAAKRLLEGGDWVAVRLVSGRVLHGRWRSRTSSTFEFEVTGGGRAQLRYDDVRGLEPSSAERAARRAPLVITEPRRAEPTRSQWPAAQRTVTRHPPDPPPNDTPSESFRTRSMAGPTAFQLRAGEIEVSQKELVASFVSVGITDSVSLHAASALPLLLASFQSYRQGAVTLRVGGELSEGARAAAGPFVLWLGGGAFDLLVAGMMGSLTFGSPDLNLTLSGLVPMSAWGFGIDSGNLRSPVEGVAGSVAATARVGNNVAFVTEHWLFPAPSRGALLVASGLAIRFFGRNVSLDLGVVSLFNRGQTQSGFVPLPWVDLTFRN